MCSLLFKYCFCNLFKRKYYSLIFPHTGSIFIGQIENMSSDINVPEERVNEFAFFKIYILKIVYQFLRNSWHFFPLYLIPL